MHARLLKSIARAQSTFIAVIDSKAAFESLLSDVLELSDSEYGFIGEVLKDADGQPYLKTHAITNIAWDDDTREFFRVNAPDGLKFTNLDTLFGAAIRTGKPVVTNSPENDERSGGLPDGHPPLKSFLGLPIFFEEEMVAMLGMANRPDGYDQSMVEYLYPLTATIGQMIETRRARTSVRDLEQQLLAARKMEAIGQLAGGIAHDFNNMLQVIQGYCEIAIDEVQPGTSVFASLEQIAAATARSAALTGQLLSFAQRQPSSPVVTRLNTIVPPMVAMLRRLVSEGVGLHLDTRPDLWNVRIDRSQIDQLLANLVVNSAQAIEDQGKITIEIRNTSVTSNRQFHNEVIPAGDYVVISVIDDGSGMDQETSKRMFEPFFTTRSTGHGTGLGLSSVLGIVSQNHGGIDVHTRPGEGTRIDVYLPRCHQPLEDASENPLSQDATAGSETILLVEDQVRIMESSAIYLERLGYRVLTASRPSEALKLARENVEDIRLLVTDVLMPEMNGHTLAQELSQIDAEIPCLYISGATADTIAEHGVLVDEVHFLRKPFASSELAAAIRGICDAQTQTPIDSQS